MGDFWETFGRLLRDRGRDRDRDRRVTWTAFANLAMLSLSNMNKLLKNPEIGTRDGICGGKIGKSKPLPKYQTVTKGTFLNGILLLNIHFSLNFIQNHFFTN